VKSSEKEQNLVVIRQTLDLREDVRIIPFSAETGFGKESLLEAIESVDN